MVMSLGIECSIDTISESIGGEVVTNSTFASNSVEIEVK